MNNTALDRILDALEQHGHHPRRAGAGYSSQCPAHDDHSPSLSLRGIEGQVLVFCHAGCDTRDVLGALGLTLADLYDNPRGASYTYDDGRIVHRSPEKRFRQSGNTHGTSLYRLAKVRDAVAAGKVVFVVEGEKDVHALEAAGVVATCSPMGAGKAHKVDWGVLAGANVMIVADKDTPGEKHARQVLGILTQLGATVAVFHAKTGKDAADHLAAGHALSDLIPANITTPATTAGVHPLPARPITAGDDLPATGTDLAPVVALRPLTNSLRPYLLPETVWEFSQVTAHIKQAALARLVCPDAVLHCVLAKVASLLHHQSHVETGKGASTLSYYAAAVGKSGAGKTEAMKVADDLLDNWATNRFAITGDDGYFHGPLGSGEGCVEAFMGEIKVPLVDVDGQEVLNKRDGTVRYETRRAQVRHNALFCSDEGRQVLALDARKGSTLFPVLCELWSGAMAGQTNADATRTRKIDANSYVIGLFLGFQPSTIDDLFTDAAGGTPQRFMFAPAEYEPYLDDLDSDVVDEWPGSLDLNIPASPTTVSLAREQRTEVRRSIKRKAGGLGDDNPLDGHRMLLRCRVAALLSLLHGETVVSEDVWLLADTLVTVSCALRDRLADLGKQRLARERQARQDETVATQVRAAHKISVNERIIKAASLYVGYLAGGPLTAGVLRHRSKRHRDVADEAIDYAVNTGMITTDDGGKTYRLED